jgi:excreted virulence factor EspC (type VII ESX diderm)
MTEQYEVLSEALVQHAGKVERIADQVAQATAAGEQMSLPPDTYGALYQHLALKIGALEALGTVALSACGKQLRSAAGGIRATARDYTAVDDANKLALQRAARVR